MPIKTQIFFHVNIMKILSVLSLLFLLTNCSGNNLAKVKFGERCTASDAKTIARKILCVVCE